MNLFLEPVDVWLFRDGRPFNAGDEHQARGSYPPFPSVVQGAIRSHHLVVRHVDLSDRDAIAAAVGTADGAPPGFQVRGPFVARKHGETVMPYLPRPADAVRDRDGRLRALVPQPPPPGAVTNLPSELSRWLLPDAPDDTEEMASWLSLEQLATYLESGSCPATEELASPVGSRQRPPFVAVERRIGISLDGRRRTVEEGALYEAEFVRPVAGTGLYVEVDGLEGWRPAGIMRLGGEGRASYFHQVSPVAWPSLPDPLPSRFKLYFATPAYFERGWIPNDWAMFFDGSVRLVAAALPRYVAVGGYDLAARAPKPSRRYVPAGSVYFFEASGPARLRGLPRPAVTEDGAFMGLGQVLVGRW